MQIAYYSLEFYQPEPRKLFKTSPFLSFLIRFLNSHPPSLETELLEIEQTWGQRGMLLPLPFTGQQILVLGCYPLLEHLHGGFS